MDRSLPRPEPTGVWLTGGHIVDVRTGSITRDAAVEVTGGRIGAIHECSLEVSSRLPISALVALVHRVLQQFRSDPYGA